MLNKSFYVGVILASVLIVAGLWTSIAVNANQEKRAAPPELRVLGFSFEGKTITRLEAERIERGSGLTPTELFTYRAELGGAPDARYERYQYQRKQEQVKYAVLRVTNESSKTIKTIDWEFTYPHFKGDKEIPFLKTQTNLAIEKGRTATLSTRLPSENDCGLVWVVQKGQAAMGRNCGRQTKRMTGIYPIEVRLVEISYQDGTVWKAQP